MPYLLLFLACVLCLTAGGADRTTTNDWQGMLRQVEQEAAKPTPTYAVVEGEFSLASDVRDDPQVTCRWATARMDDGRPAPRAQEVVYYFHQPGNLAFQRDPLFRTLVQNGGFTVCGVRFPASSEPALFSDQQRFYAFGSSGSLATIRRALGMLRERLSLPDSPVFLFGYSAGGIGVQRFAEEYPELCGGVVTYCGHSFVQKRKARCPFLIVHNFGDATESGQGLESYYRLLGTPVIRLVLPPVWEAVERNGVEACHHQNRPWIDRLVTTFFTALSDRRRDPPGKAWPLTVDARDVRHILADGAVRDPGDLAIRVPSTPFYSELLRIPPESITIDGADGRRILVALPAWSQAVRGLVAMVDASLPTHESSLMAVTPMTLASRYGACLGLVTTMVQGYLPADEDLRRIGGLAGMGESLPRSIIICAPSAQVAMNYVRGRDPNRTMVLVLKGPADPDALAPFKATGYQRHVLTTASVTAEQENRLAASGIRLHPLPSEKADQFAMATGLRLIQGAEGGRPER